MIDIKKLAGELRDTATWLNQIADQVEEYAGQAEKLRPLFDAMSAVMAPQVPVAVPAPVAPAREAQRPVSVRTFQSTK